MSYEYYTTRLAESIMNVYHYGQVSKDGKPYYLHLYDVAERVKEFIDDEDEYMFTFRPVALLHDILEDTNYPEDKLIDEFGYDIYNAIKALTRGKDESYSDFIKRCKRNRIAYYVKIADLQSNMNIGRLADNKDYDLAKADFHRMEKYFKAYQYLRFGKGEPID